MSSTSETGHAKNVANFGTLITTVETFGPSYNPSANEIKLLVMRTLKIDMDVSLIAVRNAETPYKIAVNRRQEGFEGMSTLTTRVLNALAASGASQPEMKDARGMAKKITGGRVKAIKPVDDSTVENMTVEAVVRHSVSQMSFDKRVENFKNLIAFVAAIPKYNPNEQDLKVTALTAYVNSLLPLNDEVERCLAVLNRERERRNTLLYAPVTGAIDIAKQVKQYVKSVFGATSTEYKEVAAIEFKVIK